MISINNLDYFKIFFQKTTNTLLVSLGEIHSLEKCFNHSVSIDLPVMMNQLVEMVHKNIVVLLIEAQATSEWSNHMESTHLYDNTKNVSKLYETCYELHRIKNIDHKFLIDPRRFPHLSSLMDFYYLFEKNNYTLDDFIFLNSNFSLLYKQIESFLFLNNFNAAIQKVFWDECYAALHSLARVNEIFMGFQQQNILYGTSVSFESISSLVDQFNVSIYRLWINVQDFYAVTKIQVNSLNIMYTGASHNINVEEKFLTPANGWEIMQEGIHIGRNCVSVQLEETTYIVDHYNKNWKKNVVGALYLTAENNSSDSEMELSDSEMELSDGGMQLFDSEMELFDSDDEPLGSEMEIS
jgi:hypothetical protein